MDETHALPPHGWKRHLPLADAIVFGVVPLLLGMVPALLMMAVIVFPISIVLAGFLLLAAPFVAGVRLLRARERIRRPLPEISGVSQRRYLGASGKWLCAESPRLLYCAFCGGRPGPGEARDCSFCVRDFCAACYREHLENPRYWHYPYLARPSHEKTGPGSHIAKGHAPCHNLDESRSGK